MSKKKHPEVRREIQNPLGYPPGTVLEEFMDGSITKHNPDGTQEQIDARGNPPSKVNITDVQIEAWKKAPREEALKEALKLFREQNMDVSEARMKLEVLKFISELQGARVPVANTQNIVSVQIHVADMPPGMKVIQTTPIHREQ